MGGRFVLRVAIAVVGLAVLMLGLPSAATAAAKVVSARLGQHGTATRFVVDMTEALPFRSFTLNGPPRLVLDMPDVEWQLDAPFAVGGLVRSLQHGLVNTASSRVILDLRQPVEIVRSFTLEPTDSVPHHRLVIDIRPMDDAAYRQTAEGSYGVDTAEAKSVAVTRNPTAPVPAAGLRPDPDLAAKLDPVDGSVAAKLQQVAFVPVPRPRPAGRYIPRRPVIVIDAGHGGRDPGALGNGLREKDVTLQAAHLLSRELEGAGRYKVVLTRANDTFIRLRDRVAMARAAKAELFISLHADSHADPTVKGASVYTLSETASDKEAGRLARQENKADVIGGLDLGETEPGVAGILIALSQRDTMNGSSRAATSLINALKGDVDLLGRTHRFAGFAVLKAPDVPSILVEMGYLSNPQEARRLNDIEAQRRLMRGIRRAVDGFFEQRLALQQP